MERFWIKNAVVKVFFYSFVSSSISQKPNSVVNVAGESKNLEPSGADVLGINIPFGEYLNAGSFETTFVDESMRISRSKTGPVDQLRVFVKAEAESVEEEDVVAEEDDKLDDVEIVEDDELDDDEIV